MLSRNLIKANQVVLKENDIRVIDTNELVAEKIKNLHNQAGEESASGGFCSGLNVDKVEAVLPLEGEAEGEFLPDEEAAMIHQEPVYTGPTPEELIARAEAEIEEMKQTAEEQLESMKEYTMEEWRRNGYHEGQKKAIEELEKEKAALKQKEAMLEKEYQDRISQLEPAFIETLTGIYEQIFLVDLADYKPVLLHAISNCIRNIEGGRDFIIHVSKANYEAVSKAKDELFAGIATTSATLEIVEDITLGTNQCMIETTNGIYDCSIGSQLEELGKRLRLLSYEN